MLRPAEEATGQRGEGSLLGPGWREVPSFDELDDEGDDYEYTKEELYAVLDLGQGIDPKMLLTEGTYQLIGMDSATPFLKIGNNVFRGKKEELIGDEVILDLVRDPEDPQHPNHPPRYVSSHRIGFRPVTLKPRNGETAENAAAGPSTLPKNLSEEYAEKQVRSMFMKRAAMIGPNAQTQEERDAERMASITSSLGPRDPSAPALGTYGEAEDLEDEELQQIASGALNLRESGAAAGAGGDPLAQAYRAGTSAGTIQPTRAPRNGVEFGNRAQGRPKGSRTIPRIICNTKEELNALPFPEMDPRTKVELHFVDPPELLSLRHAERRVYGIPERGPGSRMLNSLGKVPPGGGTSARGGGSGRGRGGGRGGSSGSGAVSVPANDEAMELDEYGAPITPSALSAPAETSNAQGGAEAMLDEDGVPISTRAPAAARASVAPEGAIGEGDLPAGDARPAPTPGVRLMTGGLNPAKSRAKGARRTPPQQGTSAGSSGVERGAADETGVGQAP